MNHYLPIRMATFKSRTSHDINIAFILFDEYRKMMRFYIKNSNKSGLLLMYSN